MVKDWNDQTPKFDTRTLTNITAKYYTMEQNKNPVAQFYYSKEEWDRLGCGPLPPERDRSNQLQNAVARGNPSIDGKNVKGYN